MATAVETSSQPRTPSGPVNLPLASLVGAVYVVAALAAVFYAVPVVWAQYVAPALTPLNLGGVPAALKLVTQVGVAGLLFALGRSLAGSNPPVGLRGGIFLVISAACLVFFVTRAVGLWAAGAFEDATVARAVTGGVGVLLLVLFARLLTSPRGRGWMVGLEEGGWLHAAPYKRALGQKVRRLTMLGIMLVGVTGWYALDQQGMISDAWTLAIPFVGIDGGPQTVTVLDSARYVLPVVLLGAVVWVAYRAVNMPSFAEFLIATEAEMNKVSWPTRKRLAQDTVVVLITTVAMALFLLVVDLFWGWLLSRETVGVLPPSPTAKDNQAEVKQAKW